MTNNDAIKKISKLKLSGKDVLLVEHEQLDTQALAYLKVRLEQVLPGIRAILLPKGIELKKLSVQKRKELKKLLEG